MATNTQSDTSEFDNRNSKLYQIINTAKSLSQDKMALQRIMKKFVNELRNAFSSEYCAIGTVADGIAEDSAVDYDQFDDIQLANQQAYELETVRTADANIGDTLVSKALKAKAELSFFDGGYFNDTQNDTKNFKHYIKILSSGKIENTTIIPIRDKDNNNFGFIQFINTHDGKQINYIKDILPLKNSLLELAQIMIQHRLIHKDKLLRDADFYNQMQDKRDNVDDLLDSIMEYFSNEFNSAVVSFRIPLFNVDNKDPLFYLRRVFVHKSIGENKRNQLINLYRTERLLKNREEMRIADELRCDNQGKIIDSLSDTDFSQYGLDLDDNTLIIPIFRDFDQKCINPNKNKIIDGYCKPEEHVSCIDRFKKLYGFFRLRISNTELKNNHIKYSLDNNETTKRLAYLSKQITLLLNSIIDKHENDSLQIFHNKLKKSSFIKIKDFDEQCVEIIKQSIHAKVCSIYRYDNRSETLSLSATTAGTIMFTIDGKHTLFKMTPQIQESCFVTTKKQNNILSKVYIGHSSLYVFDITNTQVHNSPFIEFVKSNNNGVSALAVPMTNKNGTVSGVVLVLGKEEHKHSFSTAYWEHDIKDVEFIVNILARISESDTERLTFLSQLSHELLAPVTELVYDNDLTVNLAERNRDRFSRNQLISKIRENIDRNMLFKYIISDTEFIYSSGGKSIEYNIVEQNKPQDILLDAIRLLEKEANFRGLTIKTYISKMPPLSFDKERMMQVFLNLLKNAIRYSDSNTTIRISYDIGKNHNHEISFANDGIGIKESEKESIFELFHRGEAAKKNFTRGTGMGLYIIRNIMRAHGGDCFVRNLDYPTVFVITLPNK